MFRGRAYISLICASLVSVDPLCYEALKLPEIAVAYALSFQMSNRVEQVLRSATPMTTGPR